MLWWFLGGLASTLTVAIAVRAAAKRKLRLSREIFTYWDGKRKRSIDPLGAWCDLHADDEFVWDRTPALVDSGDIDAIRVAVSATRRVFGVPEFSKGGLTGDECLVLLVSFFLFTEDQKKSTSAPVTQQCPTDQVSLDESTTPPDSACSSTSNVPNCDTQPVG